MSDNSHGLLLINLSGQNRGSEFTSMVSNTGKYTNTLYPVLNKIALGPEEYEKRLLNRTHAHLMAKKIEERQEKEAKALAKEAL